MEGRGNMLKKMPLFLSMTALVLLGCEDIGHAMGSFTSQGTRKAIEAQGTVAQRSSSESEEPNGNPEDKEYEELEEELKQLMEEMKRLEKELKTKIHKELLPLIRQEMERLRKWLEELHLDEDEPEPLKTRGVPLQETRAPKTPPGGAHTC
jgi:hypothetical protein